MASKFHDLRVEGHIVCFGGYASEFVRPTCTMLERVGEKQTLNGVDYIVVRDMIVDGNDYSLLRDAKLVHGGLIVSESRLEKLKRLAA